MLLLIFKGDFYIIQTVYAVYWVIPTTEFQLFIFHSIKSFH